MNLEHVHRFNNVNSDNEIDKQQPSSIHAKSESDDCDEDDVLTLTLDEYYDDNEPIDEAKDDKCSSSLIELMEEKERLKKLLEYESGYTTVNVTNVDVNNDEKKKALVDADNKNNYDNDTDDDDDAEDDGINVVIGPIMQQQDQFNGFLDIELKKEIDRLIDVSLNLNVLKPCIPLYINGTVLLITPQTRISSRLASLVWKPSKMYYAKRDFPNIDSFDKFLTGLYRNLMDDEKDKYDGTFAVFAASYKKLKINAPRYKKLMKHDASNVPTHENNNIINYASYLFYDFSCIVIRDRKLVDYAIHSHHSNINDMISTHQPKKVYFNSKIGGPLDVFLRYEHQPFYESLQNVAQPVHIERNRSRNTIIWCDRYDSFCSFCHAICDLIGLFSNLDDLRKLQFYKKLTNISTNVSLMRQQIEHFKNASRKRRGEIALNKTIENCEESSSDVTRLKYNLKRYRNRHHPYMRSNRIDLRDLIRYNKWKNSKTFRYKFDVNYENERLRRYESMQIPEKREFLKSRKPKKNLNTRPSIYNSLRKM